MISTWKKNMIENFRISHFCDIFAKKIMTKQRDETSNVRKISGFGQNDFTVSRNWGGRHPQNDQILKRPRKSTYLIPPKLPWKFQQKIFTTKNVRAKNMMGGSALSPQFHMNGIEYFNVDSFVEHEPQHNISVF